MRADATDPVVVVAEAVDLPLAERLAQASGAIGIGAVPLVVQEISAPHLIEIERKISAVPIIMVIWTRASIHSPFMLDQADIAARRHRLLNLECGSRTPIGYDRQSAAKIQLLANGHLRGEFALFEKTAALCERLGLRKPRRLSGFRVAPFALDVSLQLTTLLLCADPRHGLASQLVDLTVIFILGYAAGISLDFVAVRTFVPVRNYMARFIVRLIAQIIIPIAFIALMNVAKITFLNVASGVGYLALISLFRSTPYLLSKRLRRGLLA